MSLQYVNMQYMPVFGFVVNKSNISLRKKHLSLTKIYRFMCIPVLTSDYRLTVEKISLIFFYMSKLLLLRTKNLIHWRNLFIYYM